MWKTTKNFVKDNLYTIFSSEHLVLKPKIVSWDLNNELPIIIFPE